MTTISGKIYQMKNAAGTENRFPRTVMEAVYGLSTYLQDQFSALADIYMPIEGITESKTGQEFVYRQSPATIKAKSLTLDRIYGKTLAWNQLVKDKGQSTSTGITFTISGGRLVGSGTASATDTFEPTFIRVVSGHKYLFIAPEGFYGTGAALVAGTITTQNKSFSTNIRFAVTQGQSYSFDAPFCVYDLTLMFGAGNEPSTVEEFESMFPGYHSYSAGKLISNDAESIETVGFNQWDEEWRNGYYSASTGEYGYSSSYPNHFCSKNYIPVFANTAYYATRAIAVCFYDGNKNFISSTGDSNSFTTPSNTAYIQFTAGSYGQSYNHDICINISDPAKNGTYEPYKKSTLHLGLNNLKVKDSQGNITTITEGLKGDGDWADILYSNNHLTNKAKRVNLGELNWVAEQTYSSGIYRMKSTGVKTLIKKNSGSSIIPNYIICSKYSILSPDQTYGFPSFVGNGITVETTGDITVYDANYNTASSAEAFKAAMDGVYLDYELATPIEYELIEPLVYSMAAGTTEERISPNADGLSAPFCCDMTYDANANNDSANAQYAATAGRLYNSHKLWGQDFDGSNDVSGALSGVTTIEASGNITTVAQLISTVATGTAPLSVASTTEVANLHSYTATKLHTQRTLWGQNFDGSGNVTGDMSSVGNIAFSASGKNIASLLYFDTTNSRVGVGASSPAYKLDVNGTLNASGAATLGSTLGVAGNTTIGGTFTVGTSSVNKATTLYGALTASGAVSFTSTLGVTGLSTLAGGIKLTTTKKIWFGDTYYIELDSNNRLHTNAGFYSNSFITAGGVGSGSGGGSNLVKERAYDISLTQIASSDYSELIRAPYINDSDSGFMFAYSPAFLDTASQMHDYVLDAIGHEIGSCDIQWIGIAIGSTYTDLGVFDSGAFLVLAKSGSTYYWYEFEV